MAKGNPLKQGYMTTRGERLSYGSYFIGQNIFYILLLTFLTPYFTDVGISAATVAVITLVVKVWDAVNDPIFGGIVDKVKFKKGKFLPWLRVSLFAIPITSIFFFAIPSGVSPTIKVIWAVVGYMLWDTAYTICDVPIFGIVTTMTSKVPERTSMLSMGRVAALIAAVVVGIIVPQVRVAIGGWLPTVVVLSVVALITMLPICLLAKERVKPQNADQDVGLKDMFRFVIKNKYMLIYFGAVLLYGTSNVANTYGMYTARYLLGNEGLMTITMLVGLVPSIILGIFVPAISRKIDKYFLFMGSLVAMIVLNLVSFFVGYSNFTLYMVMLVLRSLPLGVVVMVMFLFTPDCAEYGFYKTGISAPGISFSIQTFSSKMTGALATSVGALALFIIGFVEGEGAVQAAGFNDKFWAVSMIIPVIGGVLALLLLSRYKLRDKYVQVMASFNAGEISREDAEKQLAGKI